MSPLALMIRPHGSLPHHSLALVLALTAIRASKPFSLVHITSSAPSMLIALAAKTPGSDIISVGWQPRVRSNRGKVRRSAEGRILLILDPAELLTRVERGLLDKFEGAAQAPS